MVGICLCAAPMLISCLMWQERTRLELRPTPVPLKCSPVLPGGGWQASPASEDALEVQRVHTGCGRPPARFRSASSGGRATAVRRGRGCCRGLPPVPLATVAGFPVSAGRLICGRVLPPVVQWVLADQGGSTVRRRPAIDGGASERAAGRGGDHRRFFQGRLGAPEGSEHGAKSRWPPRSPRERSTGAGPTHEAPGPGSR